jgi:hypothetical protein
VIGTTGVNEPAVTDRLSVKLWIKDANGIDVADSIKVFHRWIQTGEIGDLLIDVHDYSHVSNGPGVMLVAHEAHYRMDDTDGRLGLRYVRKRQLSGDWSDRLRKVFRETLLAAQALESEPEYANTLRFDTSTLSLRVEDRLVAPQRTAPRLAAQRGGTPGEPDTYARFATLIQPIADELYGGKAELTSDDTPGSPFGVLITGSGEPSIAELLSRLDS